MHPTLRFLLALVAVLAVIAVGVAAVVFGEADDSPGLQGLGCLAIIAATIWALRWNPRRSTTDPAAAL